MNENRSLGDCGNRYRVIDAAKVVWEEVDRPWSRTGMIDLLLNFTSSGNEEGCVWGLSIEDSCRSRFIPRPHPWVLWTLE